MKSLHIYFVCRKFYWFSSAQILTCIWPKHELNFTRGCLCNPWITIAELTTTKVYFVSQSSQTKNAREERYRNEKKNVTRPVGVVALWIFQSKLNRITFHTKFSVEYFMLRRADTERENEGKNRRWKKEKKWAELTQTHAGGACVRWNCCSLGEIIHILAFWPMRGKMYESCCVYKIDKTENRKKIFIFTQCSLLHLLRVPDIATHCWLCPWC